MERNGRAFVDHWRWAAEKGLMNVTSARIIGNACTQIIAVLDDWENLDIDQIDADATFLRFQNLRGKALTPRSLTDYRRRFVQALESFRLYLSDPASWKGPGQERRPHERARGEKESRRRVNRQESSFASSEDRETEAVPSNTMDDGSTAQITYPFPLRPDYTARILLPKDLTFAEARRLASFVITLAVDSPLVAFGDPNALVSR